MIKFDKKKWEENVSLYHLVDINTGETIETKHLSHDDAGLLNRVYTRENRGHEWREADWKKKTGRKK
ncbi:hypothetical protein CMI37_21880 [Candidatus Pacearchaeota archaeon]|nr:hypothetical protein [Candidatus Pacearchaeota archaeon]|tara:strand:+ start:295 stop:495 length:201 start_codon:yes stop_codon:yes gene_type:complete